MGWLSPAGFVDSGSVWASETLAYDEDTGTYAYASAPKGAWTDYLELTHAALDCDKVQMWVSIGGANINAIEFDVYYGSAWQNIYSGAITAGAFVEYAIGSTQSVTAMRVRFYSTKAVADGCMVHEADFWEVISGATHYGSATLVGTGLLSAIGGIFKLGAATLVGTGSLVASAFATLVGKATLAGTGGLAAIGRRIYAGAASLVGAGTLSAIGQVISGGITHYGSAVLSGVGSLSTIGRKILAGVATLAGTGSLSAVGQRIVTGVITLVGTGSLTALAVRQLIGKALLGGVGTLSAIGEIVGTSVTHYASALLAGVGTLIARGSYYRILKIESALTISQDLNINNTFKNAVNLSASLGRGLKLKSLIAEK